MRTQSICHDKTSHIPGATELDQHETGTHQLTRPLWILVTLALLAGGIFFVRAPDDALRLLGALLLAAGACAIPPLVVGHTNIREPGLLVGLFAAVFTLAVWAPVSPLAAQVGLALVTGAAAAWCGARLTRALRVAAHS